MERGWGNPNLAPENAPRSVATASAGVFATTTAGATATPTSALFARFGDVDPQGAIVETFAIERVHRGSRLFLGAHRNESESARTAAFAIHHQIGFEYSAVSGKGILEIVFGCVEGKISDEQFIITHVFDVP
jgi:hypothetical protein